MLEKKLNALLANYEVLFHKLQTYHWYVKGGSFFCDHAKLEQYYEQVYATIDMLAEKILMMGGKPLANLRDVLEAATIQEAKAQNVTGEQAYTSIRADFETLENGVFEIKRIAEDEGNHLISAMADELIAQLSKDLWMLDQVLS